MLEKGEGIYDINFRYESLDLLKITLIFFIFAIMVI